MIFITVIFSIVIFSGVLILFFLPPFSLCFFLSPPIKRIRLVRETVAQSCSVTKVFLEISQNSQENTCAQVFSCEFCEISKKTFFHRTPLLAASLVTRFAYLFVCLFVYLFWFLS